jgi:glycosyltransferase involved in cell wall biosynthesis
VAEKLNILQVNADELSGGAQRVARNLFYSYRACGHNSRLAVSHKVSADPAVLLMPNAIGRWGWSRFWWSVHSRCQSIDCNGRVSHWVQRLAEPRALVDYFRGVENFHFPGTWRLLRLAPGKPDILHCHNLHGDYFDLRALPLLSQQLPTVLTLHDAWLLSGHCAHSLDCERWRLGCGQCPDLTSYPAVKRDATAYNWRRKREIYQKSRLYVATPSRWLMNKVEESILALAAVETRVIPNGVDLQVFRPTDRKQVRARLGFSQRAKILLFAANGIRANFSKDYGTLRQAMNRVAAATQGEELLFIALGEDAPPEGIDRVEIRFVPYQNSSEAVACYYQAADLYVHAAKADTFPNTILEALACGTPVVATAVGGIPEQVKGLKTENSSVNQYSLDEATGLLTAPSNGEELGTRLQQLLVNEPVRMQMSRNAVVDASIRFSLKRQTESYLEWYQDILHTER